MRAREKVWSTKLRTLGGGATLSLALLAFGCGGSTPVVTPPVELPPVARNLLNTDDLAPPTVREGGPLSPTRPVARTAMRRALTSAVFSPDGQRLFALSSHGELVAYDVSSGELRGYARPWYDGTYAALQVDRSGTRVLTVTQDRASVLWDLHSDTLRTVPNVEGWEGFLVSALHPDGDRVARVLVEQGQGFVLVVSRLDDNRETRVLIASDMEQNEVPVPRYSPSGARIALVSDYGTTFTYVDAADLRVVRTESLLREGEEASGDADDEGYRVAFRPQGGQVALARPGRVELLDSLTARVRADAPLGGSRVRLEYSADGRWVVASSTTEVVVLEAETGRISGRVVLSEQEITEDDYATITAVLPGDGGFILTLNSGEARFFDATGATQELPAAPPGEFDGAMVVHSPDGAFRFRGGDAPTITRVGETTAHAEFVQEGYQVSVWGADFSVDGRTLFTRSRGGVSRFGADGMRALTCGNESPTQRASNGQVVQQSEYGGCLFERDAPIGLGSVTTPSGHVTVRRGPSPQGPDLVVQRDGSERTVTLTRSRTSRLLCNEESRCTNIARLAVDGSAVGFMDASRDGAQRTTWWEVYDTRTGRVRAQGTLPDGYHTLRMLAGGAFAVTGESRLTLHDPRGRVRLTLEGVNDLTTSPDERLLVVQTSDRVMHVIDVATQRERETWTAPATMALLRVSPDGLRILAREEMQGVVMSLDGSMQQRVDLAQSDFVTNFAATHALVCAGARAVRVDVRTGDRVDFGPCEGRPDAISEDGSLAAMTVGSSTRVHRVADGHVLTLETLVEPAPALLVVYDDTGRWDVSPLDASRVRIRAAGPGETAPLESPEAATRTDGLVGLFLSGQ